MGHHFVHCFSPRKSIVLLEQLILHSGTAAVAAADTILSQVAAADVVQHGEVVI